MSKWSKLEIENAIKVSKNFSQAYRILKYGENGNIKSLKKYCIDNNIDTTHFEVCLRNGHFNIQLTDEQLFCKNGLHKRSIVKRRYKQITKYACVLCGNCGIHNNLPLILQLDHTNGINNDNRLENLRWVCPNCHTQTPTYSGRNRDWKFCKTCNEPCRKKSGFCSRKCFPASSKPFNNIKTKSQNLSWPNEHDLYVRCLDVGLVQTGIELGVSDNAVKKRLKRFGLILPKYHTQTKY